MQKNRQILRSCQRAVNHVEHEGNANNTQNNDNYKCARNSSQELGKESGRKGNKRKNRGHIGHSIVEIDQNTEKRPEDLRKFAVPKTPVKDH